MNDALVHEIVALFRGGASMRRIARSLGVSRRTVRRALRAGRAGPQRRSDAASPRPARQPARRLRAGDRATCWRVIPTSRPNGSTRNCAGTVTREATRSSPSGCGGLRPRPIVAPVRRFETAPGLQAQMDYSTYDLDFSDEGRRRVYAFSYVLGYSRRQYLHFVEAQDFATTVREHIRAFEHLGGVAATCLYDNMKVVVSGYDGDEPVYNPRFLAFAAHYGFRPVACRPRRPQTKGKVERPFGYVESSLLGGRTFRGLEHLNETAAWWLAEVADVRVHRQTQGAADRPPCRGTPHLIPLPAQPFDASEVVYRTVDAEGFVVYRQNFYSAPWRLIGQSVAVRVTEDELVIHDRAFVEAARHPLFPRTVTGQRSRCKEHEPPRDAQRRSEQLAAAVRGVRRDRARGSWRACSPATGSARTRPNASWRWRRRTRVRDVLAALERAVRYGAFSLAGRAAHPRGAGPAQDPAGRAGRRPPHLPGPAAATGSRPRRDPPPTTRPCWARAPTMPKRPTPDHRATPPEPTKRTAAPSLHENVTAALRTLGVALAPGRSTRRCRRRRRSRSSHLEFLHRLLAGPAEAKLQRALERRIGEAKFRELTTLEGFDWAFNAKGLDRRTHRATGDLRLRAAARERDPGGSNRPGEEPDPPGGGPRRVRPGLPRAVRDQRQAAPGVHRGAGRRDLRPGCSLSMRGSTCC